MRGPRGIACAVMHSRYSACHQGILDTLYIRRHAAPVVVDNDNDYNNNKSRRDLQQSPGPTA